MAQDLDFNHELEGLINRPQESGPSVILIVNLLSEFPHRAGEIVDVISFPLETWSHTDMKNLWCSLIMGNRSIGKNGLTEQQWKNNCRAWLFSQHQLRSDFPHSLARLAIGYGSAFHTLKSLDFVLELAKSWGGELAGQRLCSYLAEPAMAHALDGRDECGPDLLEALCQNMDMQQKVGTQTQQSWIHLWGSMAMDGQNPDNIDKALEIIVSNGADEHELNESGNNILTWAQEQEIEPHSNDIEVLAGIVGAILSQGWSLDDFAMKKAVHMVRPLLEDHPAVKRERLQGVVGRQCHDEQMSEGDGTVIM